MIVLQRKIPQNLITRNQRSELIKEFLKYRTNYTFTDYSDFRELKLEAKTPDIMNELNSLLGSEVIIPSEIIGCRSERKSKGTIIRINRNIDHYINAYHIRIQIRIPRVEYA